MATRAPRTNYRVGKHSLARPLTVLRKQTLGSGPVANDAFFHALFGRVALKDGSTVELTSRYNKDTGQLELDVPDKALDALNAIGKGDKLKEYLSWLTDGAAGGSGYVKTLTSIGPFGTQAGPADVMQLLASLTVPTAELLDSTAAIIFRVWGTFAANDKEKSAHVTLNGTLLGENDLTISPNGLDWSFSGTVVIGTGTTHEVITDGLVGNTTQNSRATTITGVVGDDWDLVVYGHGDASPLEVNDVVCRAVMVRY